MPSFKKKDEIFFQTSFGIDENLRNRIKNIDDTYRQYKTMGAAILDSKALLSWSFFKARLSNGKEKGPLF